MIYLDSSALLKLLLREQETDALRTWLGARAEIPSVSSELVKVEVVRAIRRVDPRMVPVARALLAGLELVPLTGAVVDRAAEVGDDNLRSSDALHLASAMAVQQDLIAFAVYDHRLAAAADVAGLTVLAPGA